MTTIIGTIFIWLSGFLAHIAWTKYQELKKENHSAKLTKTNKNQATTKTT